MTLLQIFETGLRSIFSHRLRAFLTTLGILFGVAAVITTVAIGRSSADSVKQRISSLGTNLLTVSGGSTTTGGVAGGAGSANTLTMADVAGLRDTRNAPDILAVAPVDQTRATLVDGSQNWSTQVSGSTPEWLTTNARSVASGSFFTTAEVNAHAQKVVLGSTTATDLNAKIGDTVTINSVPYTVTGILTSSGGQGFNNPDDTAVVPITAAQDTLVGGDPNAVQRILLSARSSDVVGSAYQEANQLLLATHHTGSTTPDFSIQSQNSFLTTAASVSNTLTVLLASIAAISLLVGGIGIMNIMLVSVTERRREIGLRKAVGATPSDVLRQFLVEAASLSLVGGVLGVVVGVVASFIVPKVSTIGMTITAAPVVVAVIVSATVGLLFGGYPAARAARLAPIETLRSE